MSTMHLSLVISVFFFVTVVPTALLRTFPTYYTDCGQKGMNCVYLYDCPPDSRPTYIYMQCQRNKICCWSGGRQDYISDTALHQIDEHTLAQHRIDYNHSSSYQNFNSLDHKIVKESNSTFQTLPLKKEYSVNQNGEGDSLETKIINVGVFNNSIDRPIVSSLKTASVHLKEDENIVFPDVDEEPINDRITFIKKLYQKFAMDLKKNNSKKDNEDVSQRMLNNIVGARSNKYCKLYEKYTVDDAHSAFAIPLLPTLFPIMMQINHCTRPLPLIVGGTNASKGEFPHMAGLGYDRGEWIDFLCGGSLISERYVLTAAHCGQTKWGPPIIVRLGTRNLIMDSGQNMDVEQVIIHPDYKQRNSYNDIALVRIAPGLQMGNIVRPACLPTPDTGAGNPGNYLTASGWGRIGYGLFSSPNLQKVSLKVMDNKTCEQMFLGGRRSERFPNGIYSSMLCAAGYMDSSHDTCQGDSGGPLQTLVHNSKCMYEIVGITSFGKLCGTGIPAIYTRVSTFIPWIEDVVWPS